MLERITHESEFSNLELTEFCLTKTLILYDEKIAMFYSI